MVRSFYTFGDIIKLNDNNWDKAYYMMTFFMDRGNLEKEIRGPEDIVYHVVGELHDAQLVHDTYFGFVERRSEPMRKKRRRLKRQNAINTDQVFHS